MKEYEPIAEWLLKLSTNTKGLTGYCQAGAVASELQRRQRKIDQSLREKQNKHAERYRRNREALLRIDLDGEWRTKLKMLYSNDVKYLETDGSASENQSWIWSMRGSASRSNEMAREGISEDHESVQ